MIVEVLSLIFPSGVVYTRDRLGTGHRGHRGRRSHHDIWQCGTPNDTRMRADDRWLSETDDPPDSLLTASISSVPVGLERYGLCFHGDPLQRDREYYQLQRRGLSCAPARPHRPIRSTRWSRASFADLTIPCWSPTPPLLLQPEKPQCLQAPERGHSLRLALRWDADIGYCNAEAQQYEPPLDQLQPARQGHPKARPRPLRPIKLWFFTISGILGAKTGTAMIKVKRSGRVHRSVPRPLK